MSSTVSRRQHRLAFLMASSAVALSACGGGGGGDSTPTPPPPPPPAPVVLAGKVIGGAGAVVCLDLDGDSTCETGEARATAGADGTFALSVPAGTALNGAAVLALVPAGTGGSAHTLTAPAAKATVVSPITSIVQAGVQQGLTLAASEAATALQLQVAAANLYTDYVGDAATADTAALAVIATATVEGIRLGMPLVVAPAPRNTPDYSVYAFSYTDAQTFTLRRNYSTSTAPDAVTGRHTYYALHSGQLNGVARGTLIADTWVSLPGGWAPYANQASAHTTTTGNPSISIRGNGIREVVTQVDVDVSGRSLASVVQQTQDTAINSDVTLAGVNGAALPGLMPAGASVRRVRSTMVETPLLHATDADATITNDGATTLADLVAWFPPTAAPDELTTLWLGGAQAPYPCTPDNAGVCAAEALRATFGPGNRVDYYLCDWNLASSTSTNCVIAGSGTYQIGTAADATTPVMRFTQPPAAATVNTSERALVRRAAGIYVGLREHVPAPQTSTRPNRVAFEALATALSIPAPAVGDISPLFGVWRATFAGTATGTCDLMLVDPLGRFATQCWRNDGWPLFRLRGTVDAAGVASPDPLIADTMSGTFQSASAAGTWTGQGGSASGTWAATKH